MEYLHVSDGAMGSIAALWIVFQCGSLVALAKWLRPSAEHRQELTQ